MNGFLKGNEISYLGFLLLLSKNWFLLRKRDHDYGRRVNVDENGFYMGIQYFFNQSVIEPWVWSQQKSEKCSEPF